MKLFTTPWLLLLVGLGLSAGCRDKGASPGRTAKPPRSPYYDSSLASTATVTFTADYGRRKPARLSSTYAVDGRPVSVQQYAAWLAKKPDPAKQGKRCRANRRFERDPTCLARGARCTGDQCAVTCVDWCDAVAYCGAVGKRLCGRIGGGATPWRAYQRTNRSQWYNACVAQSNQRGPAMALGPGWLWQWEDCCDGDSTEARCRTRSHVRGQPGRHDAAAQRLVNCGAANAYGRLTRWRHVGFRCCTP